VPYLPEGSKHERELRSIKMLDDGIGCVYEGEWNKKSHLREGRGI